MSYLENDGQHTTIIRKCKDFHSVYTSTEDTSVISGDIIYHVKVKDIDSEFVVWRENHEKKSKFQGSFFDIIDRDSTKMLVKFKSYPSFVRYDCVDELNASILHLVCYFGLSEFVKDFITHENCRRPGNFSYTPLHYACMTPINPMRPGDLKTIQEILKVSGPEACADKSIHGYHPLNYSHNDEVIQYLQEIESQLPISSDNQRHDMATSLITNSF